MATEETCPRLDGVKEKVHIVAFVVYFHLFIHSIDIDVSLMFLRPTPTARVLPSADIDTDEEAGENGEPEEIDDGDFLADFPDHTEVRCVIYFLSKICAIDRFV
jgi:hypothetical protein